MDNELFNVDPNGLMENGKMILSEVKVIEEAIQDVMDAKKLLEGWVSPNKDKYEAKVNAILPKMKEMLNALKMYGTIAINTSERVINSENMVASRIDNDFEG